VHRKNQKLRDRRDADEQQEIVAVERERPVENLAERQRAQIDGSHANLRLRGIGAYSTRHFSKE